MLLVFAYGSFRVMSTLLFHLEHCIRDRGARERYKQFYSACAEADSAITFHLANRLEPFIFRKNRSDLHCFNMWFHIFFLIGEISEEIGNMFITSTQKFLNSSQGGYEKERDAVKRLISTCRGYNLQ